MRIEKLRFVGITPGILDYKHDMKLGKARGLFEFLVMKQTPTPVGYVNYGHPITYAWIMERYPGMPRRTCERHIATLRAEGYIATELKSNGFRVQVLNPKKWSSQLRLPLDRPAPVKDLNSFPQGREIQEVAHQVRQEWRTKRDRIYISFKDRSKDEKERQTETPEPNCGNVEISPEDKLNLERQIAQVHKRLSLPSSGRQKTAAELDARRRELLDQAELLRKKFKVSC